MIGESAQLRIYSPCRRSVLRPPVFRIDFRRLPTFSFANRQPLDWISGTSSEFAAHESTADRTRQAWARAEGPTLACFIASRSARGAAGSLKVAAG